jgi:glutamyl-tRNA synthetase
VDKVLKKDDGAGLNTLRALRGILAAAPAWQADPLEGAIKQYGESNGLGLGQIAQPIRVALSGTTVSPPIFQSLEFLGKDRTLGRIDRCLQFVGPAVRDVTA